MINHEMGALLLQQKSVLMQKCLHNFQSFGSETRYLAKTKFKK